MGSVLSVFYIPPPPRVPFVAAKWVDLLKEAALDAVNRSEMPLKYSEIGDMLGLNETCISSNKFKDSLIMNIIEDLVQTQQIKWSCTPGRPYVESI